mmetsp:Transcript_73221/g.214813  ORF Transcript_73221/g.214813 Transcript_73221/m.214813 type:complete len:204 (-) Transcript_73221:73-684(-)
MFCHDVAADLHRLRISSEEAAVLGGEALPRRLGGVRRGHVPLELLPLRPVHQVPGRAVHEGEHLHLGLVVQNRSRAGLGLLQKVRDLLLLVAQVLPQDLAEKRLELRLSFLDVGGLSGDGRLEHGVRFGGELPEALRDALLLLRPLDRGRLGLDQRAELRLDGVHRPPLLVAQLQVAPLLLLRPLQLARHLVQLPLDVELPRL